LKRKRLDRDIWHRIVEKRYAQKTIRSADFSGVAALLRIDRVTEPSVWNLNGVPTAIAEDGMLWLQFSPQGENYLVTAMMDGAENVRAWYVDVIAGIGFADDGVAWFDDLYADVIFALDGPIHVDDLDELDAALAAGEITGEQHALALRTVERVKETLGANRRALAALCAHLMGTFAREGS
jgi:predicted RNA-binding protein associated with RNAse of E/G family